MSSNTPTAWRACQTRGCTPGQSGRCRQATRYASSTVGESSSAGVGWHSYRNFGSVGGQGLARSRIQRSSPRAVAVSRGSEAALLAALDEGFTEPDPGALARLAHFAAWQAA